MHLHLPRSRNTVYQTARSDVHREDRLYSRVNSTRRDHHCFPQLHRVWGEEHSRSGRVPKEDGSELISGGRKRCRENSVTLENGVRRNWTFRKCSARFCGQSAICFVFSMRLHIEEGGQGHIERPWWWVCGADRLKWLKWTAEPPRVALSGRQAKTFGYPVRGTFSRRLQTRVARCPSPTLHVKTAQFDRQQDGARCCQEVQARCGAPQVCSASPTDLLRSLTAETGLRRRVPGLDKRSSSPRKRA